MIRRALSPVLVASLVSAALMRPARPAAEAAKPTEARRAAIQQALLPRPWAWGAPAKSRTKRVRVAAQVRTSDALAADLRCSLSTI